MKHTSFPRDLGAGRYLDLFIVGGVSAVLAIRFILRITGYPSLGGARFHIAHMLWGGLLMAAALLAALSFLGNPTKLWAAFVGGIGFGTFIDEIGKFITRDNDYFFQPSISLIYITFVLIYLAFRDLQMRRGISREEYLVNAIDELEEAVINDLQPEERERALRYLAAISDKDELTSKLAALIENASVLPHTDGLLRRARGYVVAGYEAAVARSDRFGGLITLFVLQLAINAGAVALIVGRDMAARIAADVSPRGGTVALLTTSDWLLLVSTLIPSIFVVVAVLWIRRSRMTALRSFHRAVLLSICFTEVFMFYRNQAAALLVLAFNLFAWACVNVVLTRETQNRVDTSRIQTRPAGA
ncbi:MAG TPA: hypothetical protein VIM21_04970 [Gemmatimonadaceae bacterium]